jgi:ATPase subunit of ABC transporter with duplicated ATPase domains
LINKGENGGRKLPEYIIEARELCKSYGERVIFKDTSFNIRRGEKVAILGNNGTGKTTLIKMLLSEEKIDSGRVYLNPSLRFGYFSQELENLNMKNRVIDELLNEGLNPKDASMMLASMFFKGDDVYKTVESLSMGEKCRVVFTKIMLSDIDVLVLDEPTNYMDIVSREKLEEVLELFKGAVLLVSHDRYFVKSIAEKIFEIDKNRIITYDGGYEYFLSKKYAAVKEAEKGPGLKHILDEISRLECEIAFISGQLASPKITGEEKSELDRKFIETARSLRGLKEKAN